MRDIIFAGLLVTVGFGCTQKSTTRQQEVVAPVDSVDFTVFREEINSIIQNSPKELNIINFVNEKGSSYIFDLTLPAENTEKFETQDEISLSWGAYMTDMVYANTYNRYDVVPYLGEIIKKITERLGVKDQIPATVKMLGQLSQNQVNKDSLDYFASQIFSTCRKELSASIIPDVYALVFIGANIESFYLLTQLTSYAKNNQEMINYLSARRDLAKSILRLMEFFPDEGPLQSYFEKMSSISRYFDSHPDFTEKELNELTIMIQDIRNDMFHI
jgi:hypothetical protein